ncbi:MAG TPA: DUF402 domain-containing protein [Armatimonadota bacterium]|nr:DUF402 domain-containing protein [Armatimonadota bacterium]
MPGVIKEFKRHYNKPDQEFDCERLHQDESLVILRYVTTQAFSMSHGEAPAGTSTLGIYRRGARAVFWKMLSPDGGLIGYLLHLCEPIVILPDGVSYKDLMLDIWQAPPAAPILLDEDDLSAAVEAGLIPVEAANEARIDAKALLTRFENLVRGAEETLRQYVGPQ